MELDGLVHTAFRLVPRLSRCNAARKIRGIRRIILSRLFYDNQKPVHESYYSVNCACFKMLFIVLLFQATYYGPDEFVYYATTFLIPVEVGLYLARARREPVAQQG